jgi:MFS family permease
VVWTDIQPHRYPGTGIFGTIFGASKLTDIQAILITVGLLGMGVLIGGLGGGVFADMVGARRTRIFAQPIATITALLFALVTAVYLISLLSLIAGLLSAATDRLELD